MAQESRVTIMLDTEDDEVVELIRDAVANFLSLTSIGYAIKTWVPSEVDSEG